MSLKIRMSRGGTKKRPYYRVVVADSRSPRDGRFIERIGSYDPMLARDNPERVKIDTDRARHWMSVGALPSDRVQRLLAGLGVGEMPKVHAQTKQAAPKAKAQERLKAAEEAAKAAAEAAAAPAAAEPAA